METLSRIRDVNSSFPLSEPIQRWKQRGGKAIGYMCTYVPEELICAAGALPVRVTGDSRELPLGDANAHLHPVSCSFSRQCLQLALEGQYSFLDGFIGGNNCDSIRRLVDNWLHYVPTPFTYILDVPHKLTPRAVEYYHGVLVDLKEKLEGFLGIDISDQALREAIDLCNTTRNLLRELYELRKQDAPPISGAETMEVLNAGFRMPKGEYNQLLVSLLKEARSGGREVRGDIRLMLSGSPLTNPDFVRSIEQLGGLVVVDELCTGGRYWSDPVAVDGAANPLEAIARRYLTKFPCAVMSPAAERLDRVVSLAQEYRIHGVVSQVIRSCIPCLWQQPLLRERLLSRGIPILELDVEYGTAGGGQTRTRVQAFLESLHMKEL
ncbi:MAG: 2-hydroxyacyl-CoA dehydratase family protein [Chloroflexota bacterium]